jgi:hypothetical protein
MTLAKQVLDCMHNSFNAYVYWWMTAGGNGVISTSGTPNKYGWVIAMFSKFVRPGYYCVDATYNPQSGVYIVAFKGDQNVIVAVNNASSSKSQAFTYSGATVTSVQKYTSSQSKNCADDGAISATNNSFTASLDAQSVTTFVSMGTPSTILRFEGDNGKYTLEHQNIPSAQHFGYLLNGKQWPLGSYSSLGNIAAGIYVFPNANHATGRNTVARTLVLPGRK